MKTIFTLALLSCFSCLLFAQPINLGAAADYAALGLQGTALDFNNVTIQGRVGVSQNGLLTVMAPSTINGNLFVNTGASSSSAGTINGSVFTNQNISQAWIDATNAANAAATMTPTRTYTNWASALTITGNGDVNVIQVNTVNLGNNDNIILDGSADDYWIINVTGSFGMNGNGSIKAGGSTTPSHILINVVGTGTTVTTQIANVIEGTLMAISRDVNIRNVLNQVIVGGAHATFQSGAKINAVPSGFKVLPCYASAIGSNFNGTAIAAGNYIWFNAHFSLGNKPNTNVASYTVRIKNSVISFSANGQYYQLDVPNAVISFSAAANQSSTTYNSTTNTWNTIVPMNQISSSEIFLSGLPYWVPAGGFPGGINPVNWTAEITNDLPPGTSIQWQWSAAVYSQFAADNNGLDVQIVNNGLHAGVPTAYKNNVIGGARGGGGSNYTGSWSATGKTNCPVGSIGKYVWRDVNRNGKADDGVNNGLNNKTVELWTSGPDGAIGGSDDSLLSIAVTDYDVNSRPGYYLFDDVTTGSYYVRFPKDNGNNEPITAPATDSTDTLATSISNADGLSPVITIVANGSGKTRNNATINAGYSSSNTNVTLPVVYSAFTAVREKQLVNLNWTTATEQNSNGFYVQRVTDGEWKDIVFVFSKAPGGNSSNESSYSFKDVNNFKGVSQYRIKQVSNEGKISYSIIRQVLDEDQKAKVSVYPNPSTGNLNVTFDGEGCRNIVICDASGRVVKEIKNLVGSSVFIDHLSTGFYLLKVTDNATVEVVLEKVLVK